MSCNTICARIAHATAHKLSDLARRRRLRVLCASALAEKAEQTRALCKIVIERVQGRNNDDGVPQYKHWAPGSWAAGVLWNAGPNRAPGRHL